MQEDFEKLDTELHERIEKLQAEMRDLIAERGELHLRASPVKSGDTVRLTCGRHAGKIVLVRNIKFPPYHKITGKPWLMISLPSKEGYSRQSINAYDEWEKP